MIPVDNDPAELTPVLLHLRHGRGQTQPVGLCNKTVVRGGEGGGGGGCVDLLSLPSELDLVTPDCGLEADMGLLLADQSSRASSAIFRPILAASV